VSAKIITLADAKERILARRGRAGECLRLTINKEGLLEIDYVNRNGIVEEVFGADDADTETIVRHLSMKRRKFTTEKYFEAHPEARPKPKREPKWRKCRVWPGDRDYRRCIRRAGHKGLHRMKGGIEFIHKCTFGTTVHASDGVTVRCACGKAAGGPQ
jgi:hypothetical protein